MVARLLQLRVDGVLGVFEVFVVVLGREELGRGPEAEGQQDGDGGADDAEDPGGGEAPAGERELVVVVEQVGLSGAR